MASLVEAHDWASTSLGPIETWPSVLRSTTDLMLAHGFPMAVLWGPDLVQVYNDGYAFIMGARHPRGLGQPTQECWPEVWHINAPIYARVRSGETVTFKDAPYPITRSGRLEDAWFTLTYSPIRDGGAIVGILVTVFEVTAEILARRSLAQSETRLQAFVTASTDVVYRMSADWTEMLALEERTFFGNTDAPSGLWLDRHIPSDDRAPVHAAIADAIRTGSTFELQHRVIRADGSLGWSQSRAVPIRDEAGDILEWLGTATDVTDKAKAAEALQESQALRRVALAAGRMGTWRWDLAARLVWGDALELVPAMLWWADPAGHHIEITPQWSAYTGQSHLEAQDFGWLDAIHPDDRKATEAAFRHAFATGEPLERQQRIHHAEDGYRWHLVRHVPVRGQSGKINGWFGAAIDMHELHERQAFGEQQLRTLVEGVPQLVWRASAGGLWTWSSPQWTAYTGLSAAQSIGSGWLAALHPDDRAGAEAAWSGASAGGALTMEVRVYSAAESRYCWFATRATPLFDADGEAAEWLGTLTDIHDLRELQEQEHVLVAELQHRTRNLMGVVRATIESTLRSSTTLDDFIAEYRDRIGALSRVQGLLSRMNAGDRITFDKLIEDEMKAVGASDQVRLEGPRGVALRSSTVQTFALALHELATNAVKYGALAQPSGRLAISWRLEPALVDEQPWLHVDWHESGVAMPTPGADPHGGGQGRQLIERALPYQLGAKTTYVMGPDGVRCSIAVPVSKRTATEGIVDDHATPP